MHSSSIESVKSNRTTRVPSPETTVLAPVMDNNTRSADEEGAGTEDRDRERWLTSVIRGGKQPADGETNVKMEERTEEHGDQETDGALAAEKLARSDSVPQETVESNEQVQGLNPKLGTVLAPVTAASSQTTVSVAGQPAQSPGKDNGKEKKKEWWRYLLCCC
ncbi:hypothetical protein MD484_g7921, partial [Candolleomyces efflorescens]